MNTQEHRIEHIERSLRRWRRLTIALIGMTACLVVRGLSVEIRQASASSEPPRTTLPKHIEAEVLSVNLLRIVDEKGNAVVNLTTFPSKEFGQCGSFIMHSPDGKGGQLRLQTSDKGAVISADFAENDPRKSEVTLFSDYQGSPMMGLKKNGKAFYRTPSSE